MKIRKGLLFSLWTIFYFTAQGYAALNDIAVFAPGVENWMTVEQQNEVASYLGENRHLHKNPKVYNYGNQAGLVAWMNKRMDDGKSDVLLILDLAPAHVFNDEDNSLAETWIENGNMLIWSGSEPFRSSVDAGGKISDLAADEVNDGANNVLDIKGKNLCTGYASTPQKYTSVATSTPGFYDYLPSLNLNYTGANMRSLKYVDVLTKAENVVSWDDAPNMVIDEMFAENDDATDTTHVYESDAIVLTMRKSESDRKGNGGQYAQFYCYKGLVDGVDSNVYRKLVLAEFLQNWVARDINLIWVEAGATNGNGKETRPFGSIQEGINAAAEFSRDRVMVKGGIYNESLVTKRSVKLISAGEDERVNVVGYLDDFNNHELNYTYNAFSQVNGKKGLTRAENTIIDGTDLPKAFAMVDIPKWATMGTWVDGFSIRNMPEVDHTICGHAHTIQTRGSSAIVIDNILFNNGSGGLGSHSVFAVNSSGEPVEDNICGNDDFSYANVKYNAHPALINNIVGASNGPNLGNNHYSYSIMYHNECYKSGYFGKDLPKVDDEAPGIGNQHGAHSYIYNNVVYDSSWTGIGSKRGDNKLNWIHNIDRPTRPIVKNNYVFNSGMADVPGPFGAGIGGRNTGGPDPYSGQILYHVIDHNFVFKARDAAIGISYREDEDGTGTIVPRESTGYVIIKNNTAVNSDRAGIAIDGAHDIRGILHNELTGNTMAGIGIKNGGRVGHITANSSHNNAMAGIGMKSGAHVDSISENLLVENMLAGIAHLGYNDDGSENKVIVGQESGNIIEWNLAAGIGMQHAQVDLMSMNTIRFNAEPGIAVAEDSDVSLIEGSASTEGPERISENGRSDLHYSSNNTAGLVVVGEGSTANISNLIVEKSGMVNIEIGEGAEVTMDGTAVRGNNYGGPNVHITGTARISNCILENAVSPGLVAGIGSVISLEDTIIRGNGTVGVNLAGATVTSFRGNTVSDNQAAGIVSVWLGSDLHIENSSILNNGTPGIIFKDLEYNVTISDSLISGNGMGGVRVTNSKILDIRDTVIHNSNGGLVVHDSTQEQASVVNLSNCNMDYPESIVRIWGGSSLNITKCSLHGIELHDIDSVSITGSSNTHWNIGIYLDGIGWADVIGNDLGGRWPIKMKDTSGNIVNNVNGLGSDGYIFEHSTANFYHNTIYGGDNILVPGNPYDTNLFGLIAKDQSVVYAYNNIITGAQFGIRNQDGSIVYADNNLLWGCKSKFHGNGTFNTGVKNLIDVDPQLVDPLNRNYHLSPTSPCIDSGDNDIGVTEDMDGDLRPMGGGSDIGSDEVM